MKRFQNFEETVQCINQKFERENQCLKTSEETIGSYEQKFVKDSRRPVRVVKVKKRRQPLQVTVDPFAVSSEDATTKRPRRTLLAFHRQGSALKVIPLVEKEILENKAKKGILSKDNTDGIQLKDTSNRQPRDVPISGNLGRVTFRGDGNINIRLVDAESQQSNINHVMNKDSSIPNGASDSKPSGQSQDKPNEPHDPAGSSHVETEETKVTDLKLWTYDNLMDLGQILSHWMADQIVNSPKGKTSKTVVAIPDASPHATLILPCR